MDLSTNLIDVHLDIRLRVRNMEVDSSYSYYACRGHVRLCVQCPSQWGK